MPLKYNAMSQIMSWTNRERKFQRAIVPGSEYSSVLKFQGRKFLGQFAPGNESSREREGQGAKGPGSEVPVPGSELAKVLLADSLQGANWPGSEKAVNQ